MSINTDTATFYNYLKRFTICNCDDPSCHDGHKCNDSYFKFSLNRLVDDKDLTSYYEFIHALEFLKRYSNIMTILPNIIMTSKKIKNFLIHFYNIVYFDDLNFKNIWMDYFKWKLLKTDQNVIPGR